MSIFLGMQSTPDSRKARREKIYHHSSSLRYAVAGREHQSPFHYALAGRENIKKKIVIVFSGSVLISIISVNQHHQR